MSKVFESLQTSVIKIRLQQKKKKKKKKKNCYTGILNKIL